MKKLTMKLIMVWHLSYKHKLWIMFNSKKLPHTLSCANFKNSVNSPTMDDRKFYYSQLCITWLVKEDVGYPLSWCTTIQCQVVFTYFIPKIKRHMQDYLTTIITLKINKTDVHVPLRTWDSSISTRNFLGLENRCLHFQGKAKIPL